MNVGTTLVNHRKAKMVLTGPMLGFLRSSGCGLLAGWGPSQTPGRQAFIGEDWQEFSVRTPADCRMFARLLRATLQLVAVRNRLFVVSHRREIRTEDVTYDERTVLEKHQLAFLERVARFFEGSKWVRAQW